MPNSDISFICLHSLQRFVTPKFIPFFILASPLHFGEQNLRVEEQRAPQKLQVPRHNLPPTRFNLLFEVAAQDRLQYLGFFVLTLHLKHSFMCKVYYT